MARIRFGEYVPRRGGESFEQMWDADDWRRMLSEMGVAHLTAVQLAQPFASIVQPERFSAGMFDVRAFVPQFLHETAMGKKLEEDLSYSAERIAAVWPARFKTPEAAAHLARNPRALGNAVYGGRMGNVLPDDGYRFRGRGAGITGRTNYAWLEDTWGQDLTVTPEMLEQPSFAVEAFWFWWEGHMPDKALSDQAKVRKVVQGGALGLDHCIELHNLCTRVTA